MRKLFIYLFLIILFACKKEKNDFPPIKSQQNIKIDSLTFEKIDFDLNEYECSYYGYTYFTGNEIHFIDKYFCWLYAFSPEGKILYRELGQGRGPKEVVCKRISSIAKLQNKDLLILGYTLDHYFFNKNYEKKDAFLLSNNQSLNIFERSDTYTTFYPNLEIKDYDNNLFYNIYSESDHFNFIDTPEKYYKNCKTFMQVDRETGNVKKLFGNYPPAYLNNIGKYNSFLSLNYTIDSQGNFYIAYEADSTIYKYSKNFTPLKAIGYKGKNMATNYKRLDSWKDFSTNMQDERSTKGYYISLYVSEFNNVIFRSYQKGIHTNNDGLQIYQNDTLIGDICTPKFFKIRGYIAPYYYSEIINDVENEKMYIYRFKLP